MRYIPLTKGYFAIVDDEDFAILSTNKWCVSVVSRGKHALIYAVRRPKASTKLTLMHRVITNAPEGMETDHADGNGLNNIRKNLRVCTRTQNSQNSVPQHGLNRTSHYIGVCLTFPHRERHRRSGSLRTAWRAQLISNGRIVFCKEFRTEIEAARAYNQAAKKHHGEFAWLNQVKT